MSIYLSLDNLFANGCMYVIFKNRAGLLYRDLKHEAIAECFRPNKAPTAIFLNVL